MNENEQLSAETFSQLLLIMGFLCSLKNILGPETKETLRLIAIEPLEKITGFKIPEGLK